MGKPSSRAQRFNLKKVSTFTVMFPCRAILFTKHQHRRCYGAVNTTNQGVKTPMFQKQAIFVSNLLYIKKKYQAKHPFPHTICPSKYCFLHTILCPVHNATSTHSTIQYPMSSPLRATIPGFRKSVGGRFLRSGRDF